nr:DNA replication complex GINS protein PSF3 [Hymenolepis microstoma]CUU97462.1 DNA replication complex GINS protein PSF3 [Hymenolepis microstoma]
MLSGSLPSSTLLKDQKDAGEVEIASGAKVEVPFWLLKSVGNSARHVFQMDLPSIYKESYREVFAANAWVVDLRKKSPYFYSFCCHLAKLSLSEIPAVLSTLEEVFKHRLINLMESALNANKGSMLSLTARLEELEQALFRIGRNGRNSIDQWFSRMHERLEASNVVKDVNILSQTDEGVEAVEAPSAKRKRLGQNLEGN